jgi:hypothetical protein
MSKLENELAAAKAEAARHVHRLERQIDVRKQIEDAEARIARRDVENKADQAKLVRLTAELASLA